VRRPWELGGTFTNLYRMTTHSGNSGPMSPDVPERLAVALRGARRAVALTGAGISAESGIPTFRDSGGLWSGEDPRDVATPDAFERDPGRVWRFYAQRRTQMESADPNPGHLGLAEIGRRVERMDVVTQNIDDLHARAGSTHLIRLHGDIGGALCSLCAHSPVDGAWRDCPEPPPCERCGGLLRPDIVWFGESLPTPALEAALEAVRDCDVCLTIGTSGEVEPAASLVFVALEAGALVAEINPNPTAHSPWVHDRIQAPAGVALPALVRAAWPEAAPPLPGALTSGPPSR